MREYSSSFTMELGDNKDKSEQVPEAVAAAQPVNPANTPGYVNLLDPIQQEQFMAASGMSNADTRSPEEKKYEEALTWKFVGSLFGLVLSFIVLIWSVIGYATGMFSGIVAVLLLCFATFSALAGAYFGFVGRAAGIKTRKNQPHIRKLWHETALLVLGLVSLLLMLLSAGGISIFQIFMR